MKLIPEWRSAWRMFSVQLASLAVAFGLLPPNAQTAVLAAVGVTPEQLPAALGLLFIATRLLSQGLAARERVAQSAADDIKA
jgi:hypothetical protein